MQRTLCRPVQGSDKVRPLSASRLQVVSVRDLRSAPELLHHLHSLLTLAEWREERPGSTSQHPFFLASQSGVLGEPRANGEEGKRSYYVSEVAIAFPLLRSSCSNGESGFLKLPGLLTHAGDMHT